ncbi:MAG: hypothetical protein KAY32_05020 [Candidatus Eisenbacteria sp.]|nr:hypothetical protein [Candidatus Eisenbacteria bacterium]
MRRAGRFGMHLLLLVGFSLVAGPASAAQLAPRETRILWERRGWDPGSRSGGEVQETLLRARHAFAWGERLEAGLEISDARATRSGVHVGPGVRGALLLRLRAGSGWLLQAGAGTPAGIGRLGARSREVAALVGDPLFAFTEPEIACGWRVHCGAVHGIALSHSMTLALGIGVDLLPAYEAGFGLSLDPADRLAASAALHLRRPGANAQIRLSGFLEGDEELEGAPIRRSRELLAVDFGIVLAEGPVRGALQAGLATSSEVSSPDPATYGAWLLEGPGLLAQFGLQVRPAGRWSLGRGIAGQPSLDLLWRRALPQGLPAGGGWAVTILPRFSLFRGAGELAISGGWGSGHWSAWEATGRRPQTGVDGWIVRGEIVWRWDLGRETQQATEA